MDLRNGKATLLGNLWELEPVLNGQDFFGNSAWDRQGRFYFTAFPKQLTDAGRTKLVAIDPVRFTAAVARRHAPAPIRHDWQQQGRGINAAGRS
jgi:hypothetical protein